MVASDMLTSLIFQGVKGLWNWFISSAGDLAKMITAYRIDFKYVFGIIFFLGALMIPAYLETSVFRSYLGMCGVGLLTTDIHRH